MAPFFRLNYRLDAPLQGALRGAPNAIFEYFPRLVTLKVICVGSPYAGCCHVGLEPRLDEAGRQAALHALVNALRRRAWAEGTHLVAFKDIAPAEDALVAPLVRMEGFAALDSLPVAILDLPYADADGYLASLSAATRKNIRRKLARAQAVRIKHRSDIGGLEETIGELYESTRRRSALRFRTWLLRWRALHGLFDQRRGLAVVLGEQGNRFFAVPRQRRLHDLPVLQRHARLQPGTSVTMSKPRNHFALDETAEQTVLFSAGIGLTPILAMAWHLHERGGLFTWYVSARDRDALAWRDEIDRWPFHSSLRLHLSADVGSGRLDADRAMAGLPPQAHIYICGPKTYMDALAAAAKRAGLQPARIHLEHFGAEIDVTGVSFTVVAARSGQRIEVAADESILSALGRAGFDIPTPAETASAAPA